MLRVPGPADLLTAAVTVKDGVTEAIDLGPRLLDLLTRVEAMVARGEALLDDAEALLEDATQVMADSAITRARVDEVTDMAARTAARTDAVVDQAEVMTAEASRLLPSVTPVVDKALPVADAVLGSIDAEELRAMIGLVDRLPAALQHLDQIAPDVHEILDSVTDLSHAAQGLPGMSSLIRRGERKDDPAPGA